MMEKKNENFHLNARKVLVAHTVLHGELPTEVEQSILEDLRNRVQLSSMALPSVSFYTFINTHNSLNCSSISHDGSLVAGGFSDSSLKVWDMSKLGQQAATCKFASDYFSFFVMIHYYWVCPNHTWITLKNMVHLLSSWIHSSLDGKIGEIEEALDFSQGSVLMAYFLIGKQGYTYRRKCLERAQEVSKVGRLPTSYLGIPLGTNHKSVAIWDGVEERFRKRLVMWKRQFISKGGRITLIRSTLSRGALERKPHLVKWDTVCLDKRKGGLGVRRLSTLNRALLCKWNWRFANERKTLWRRVISRKFEEEEGGWYTRDVREGFGVGFWKEIRKEGALLQNNMIFSVRNGRRVQFWKDNWCGNFTLCNSFPFLYAFASYKEAWLVELWDHSGEKGVWSPSFSRPFNDWEVEEVERLLLTIRGRRLNPLLEDRMLWKETKDEIFSVKSLYSTLASRRVVP
ncbi:Transcription initiation factor TFIID subunit 5 [Vitis vinifera]|uniref:Transcription initiation factor TFIID subunit 5 n=1 Tax=Vitis vinifera TaxID=29760 RepID=A0A438F2E9_VITVI|nr:Transcription initiation factor TFIID subunit 5 [Vitis vinifera]